MLLGRRSCRSTATQLLYVNAGLHFISAVLTCLQDNTQHAYNITKVLNEHNTIDVRKYANYGPPYYAIANLFVTGGNFVYYTFSIVYVFVKYWAQIKKAFVGLVLNTWHRRSIYTGFDDGQTRMIRKYKEVPEWVRLIR